MCQPRRSSLLRSETGFTAAEFGVWMGLFGVIIPLMTSVLWMVTRRITPAIVHTAQSVQVFYSLDAFLIDARSGSRNALGNLLMNGNFEMKDTYSKPQFWPASVTGNGAYEWKFMTTPESVASGVRALMLKSNNATLVTYDSTHT